VKKRPAFLLGTVLVTALILCLIFTNPSAPKGIPRFVPGRSAAIGNFQGMHYNWFSEAHATRYLYQGESGAVVSGGWWGAAKGLA